MVIVSIGIISIIIVDYYNMIRKYDRPIIVLILIPVVALRCVVELMPGTGERICDDLKQYRSQTVGPLQWKTIVLSHEGLASQMAPRLPMLLLY